MTKNIITTNQRLLSTGAWCCCVQCTDSEPSMKHRKKLVYPDSMLQMLDRQAELQEPCQGRQILSCVKGGYASNVNQWLDTHFPKQLMPKYLVDASRSHTNCKVLQFWNSCWIDMWSCKHHTKENQYYPANRGEFKERLIPSQMSQFYPITDQQNWMAASMHINEDILNFNGVVMLLWYGLFLVSTRDAWELCEVEFALFFTSRKAIV